LEQQKTPQPFVAKLIATPDAVSRLSPALADAILPFLNKFPDACFFLNGSWFSVGRWWSRGNATNHQPPTTNYSFAASKRAKPSSIQLLMPLRRIGKLFLQTP
jgi:hypothetical protein